MSSALVAAGFTSFPKLLAASSAQLEITVKRNAPFGDNVSGVATHSFCYRLYIHTFIYTSLLVFAYKLNPISSNCHIINKQGLFYFISLHIPPPSFPAPPPALFHY